MNWGPGCTRAGLPPVSFCWAELCSAAPIGRKRNNTISNGNKNDDLTLHLVYTVTYLIQYFFF